jgi:hypothetical protein
VNLKTAQPLVGQHVPFAKVTTIAWLPGPVKAPQRTPAIGSGNVVSAK